MNKREPRCVARLSNRVRRELTYLSYPSRDWTVPRYRDGARVLDVLIVGGGQSGLAIGFGLKLERIATSGSLIAIAVGSKAPGGGLPE